MLRTQTDNPPERSASNPISFSRFGPAVVVALFLIGYLGFTLAGYRGDAGEMARLGIARLAEHATALEGYDGQYVYLLALNPDPDWAAQQPSDVIDVPAYRYQRILLPLVARAAALGQSTLIPWAIIIINLIAQVVGTYIISEVLAAYGISRWYAIVYGLWVGFIYAVRLALTEPLAYALVAGALLATQQKREMVSALLYGLALFTKEVTVLFVGAHLIWLISQRHWRSALRLIAISLFPFALFQIYIYLHFGRLGLGSGGYLGTSFEIIPYMDLWRIGAYSLSALVLFCVIFIPIAVLPSLWGIVETLRRLWKADWALPVLMLGVNAAFIPLTPNSTFREPLGMTRLLCGLVLAVLVFGAYAKSKRVLNYSALWLAALVFLLNER